MDARTVRQLNGINRRFYSRSARSFSATRSRPWKGWDRAAKPFVDRPTRSGESQDRRTILDVGCGNGRFASYLGTVLDEPLDYMGIDASAEMLALARTRLASIDGIEARFLQRDLSTTVRPPTLAERGFDLIVVFGLLHHLPGLDRRRRLLIRLARRLAPGGLLTVSFWQFGARERFRKRILDWSELAAATGDVIDEDQLEAGDFLLAWGEGDRLSDDSLNSFTEFRYCHYADPAEARSLVGSLDLSVVDEFDSDGRNGDLNKYYVLKHCRNRKA